MIFKRTVILLAILSSISLYTLIFIPPGIIKMLEFAVPLVLVFLIPVFRLYDKSFRFSPKFRVEVGLIFLAVIISMFAAFYFHRQSFANTAVVQRFIYFLLFYPVLHVLKPKPGDLIKFMVIMGVVYAGLYILQSIVYPTKLVTSAMFMERNTLRIAMPGSGYLFLAYLIALSWFIRTNNPKFLLVCILALTVFMMQGTRQVLLPAALITILSILFSRKVKSRPVILLLVATALIPVYFIFSDIFNAIVEVTQQQAASPQENIRVKAALFFLNEFTPNKLAYITGNGVPSTHSVYGMRINDFKELFGYFQSDIGIIGDYTKFGILIVVAEISIFLRVMLMRLPVELAFLKYNVLASILAIMFSSAFSYADTIVVICMTMYLVDTAAHFDIPEEINLSPAKNDFPADEEQVSPST
jgi:hypothetical protein